MPRIRLTSTFWSRCRPRDDAKHAFRARHHGEQIVPGHIERLAAEVQRFALEHLYRDAKHVVDGQPVLEAVHAARVFGDVAANAACNLRRRIGRVVEAVLAYGFTDGKVGHTRFDRSGTAVEIDFEDSIELGQDEQDTLRVWACAAGKPGPCPSRDHRNLVFPADS